MTDPHHPPHHSDPLDPLDELASAHLDGATSPDEAARVATDPELAARVERLAAAREALRAAVDEPADAARRDAAIAAALSAFAEVDQATGATAVAVPLVRPHRSRPRTRTLQVIGIAAAAVALALTVPLLDRLGSDDRDDTASSSFDATGGSLGPSLESGDGAGGGVADSASGLSGFDAATAPDLGAFADLAALHGEVRAQVAGQKVSSTTAPVPATAAADGESAPERNQTCAPASAGVVYVARATLDGQPVTVVVRDDGAGQRTLVVLDAACATLSEAPL